MWLRVKLGYYAVPSESKLLGSNLWQSTRSSILSTRLALRTLVVEPSYLLAPLSLLASSQASVAKGQYLSRSGLQKPNCFYTKHHLTYLTYLPYLTSRWTELPSHPGSLSLVLSFDRFRNSTRRPSAWFSSVHPRPRLRQLYILL